MRKSPLFAWHEANGAVFALAGAYCDRGFAEYLFLWLADAAAEFTDRGSPDTP